jgi:hypothetical protein
MAPMRTALIVLLCGLAAAAALLALRRGDAPDAAPPVSVAPASAAMQAPSPWSRLPVTEAPSAAARPPASAAPAGTGAAAKPAAPKASPVQSTFALSSDHQALIHDAVLAAADHETLEHEPRDDAWATQAEQLIRQSLARHGSARNFDVIAVDCRQTLCAIQAFSYGESGQREWVNAIDELYKETLVSMFDSVNTAFPNQGSRSPVLSFLHRRPAR